MPGPVPGFFGFGMLVSAYILFPVSPVWGFPGGHAPMYAARFAARLGRFCGPGGPIPGQTCGAVWRVNWGRSICPHADHWPGRLAGPMGPDWGANRAHGARTPGAWAGRMPGRAGACRGTVARAGGVMLRCTFCPADCMPAQYRIGVNP